MGSILRKIWFLLLSPLVFVGLYVSEAWIASVSSAEARVPLTVVAGIGLLGFWFNAALGSSSSGGFLRGLLRRFAGPFVAVPVVGGLLFLAGAWEEASREAPMSHREMGNCSLLLKPLFATTIGQIASLRGLNLLPVDLRGVARSTEESCLLSLSSERKCSKVPVSERADCFISDFERHHRQSRLGVPAFMLAMAKLSSLEMGAFRSEQEELSRIEDLVERERQKTTRKMETSQRMMSRLMKMTELFLDRTAPTGIGEESSRMAAQSGVFREQMLGRMSELAAQIQRDSMGNGDPAPLTSAGVTGPALTSAGVTVPALTSAGVTVPALTSAGVTSATPGWMQQLNELRRRLTSETEATREPAQVSQ